MKKFKLLIITILFVGLITGSVMADWEAPYDFDQETVEIAGYLSQWGRNWNTGEDLAHLELIEKKFNVNIEFVNTDMGAWELLETDVPAGDKPFDIGFINTGMFVEQHEYVLPLDDYLTQDILDRMIDVGMTSFEQLPRVKGRILGIETAGQSHFLPPLVYWNYELFEEAGVKTPYEYMAEDEWTWENFIDVAQQLTLDTTGDGQTDQFGIATNFDGWAGEGLFMDEAFIMPRTLGAEVIAFEDGHYIFKGQEPEFLEALELRREIYEMGIETEYDAWNYWNSGNAAMFPTAAIWAIADQVDDAFEFGIAYYPRGENVDEHIVPVRSGNAMYIPKTQDREIEMLIELYLALYRMAEPYVDAQEIEENYADILMQAYGDSIHDRTAAMVLLEAINKAQWDFAGGMVGHTGGTLWEAIEMVIFGDASPEAAMDEVAPIVQADLYDMFD